MRMMDPTGRKKLYNDPSVAGIIYHTVKFCDFYSFEYAEIKNHTDVPLLKIESDYTIQSSGQLLTRLEAFAESIQPETLEQTIDGDTKGERKMGKGYFAGIDSGSTSTDVVILNKDHEIVTSIILPTGAGAAIGADRALAEALKEALKTLFENDASSARPEGSMEVCKMYWWQHDEKTPAISSGKIQRGFNIKQKKDRPKEFTDYEITWHVDGCKEPEEFDFV